MAKVDQETAKLAMIPEFQTCVGLVFYEVKVREDLVYDKEHISDHWLC